MSRLTTLDECNRMMREHARAGSKIRREAMREFESVSRMERFYKAIRERRNDWALSQRRQS